MSFEIEVCPKCFSDENVLGRDWDASRAQYDVFQCTACGREWKRGESHVVEPPSSPVGQEPLPLFGLQMKYFVMKPHGNTPYTRASRIGIRAYAEAIAPHDPPLAADLFKWVGKEEQEVRKYFIVGYLSFSDNVLHLIEVWAKDWKGAIEQTVELVDPSIELPAEAVISWGTVRDAVEHFYNLDIAINVLERKEG